MKRALALVLTLPVLAFIHTAQAAHTWNEGRDYFVLSPTQHTKVPAGKVEVMEVFSYACPACNHYQPLIEKLRHSLPANVQMVFLPAAFNPAEDWPMFQRAYFAAQSLGIAERTHQQIYDAIWKTGELAIVDPSTHRLKSRLPSIDDAARCYGKLAGINPADFLSAARSFGVEVKIKAADKQIEEMQVPSTPCFVVNGKYRINPDILGNPDDLIDLVKFLVTKETAH